jgi:hypothetical protein
MFNKNNYDKKVISTFEIVGCYFVDVFYNHLYNKANERLNTSSNPSSLTDEYKNCINQYVMGATKIKDCYTKMMTELHSYYQNHTRFSTITLNDFINNILQQYVPQEYYDVMKDNDKNLFIGKTILKIIRKFQFEIIKFETLRKIIDNHQDPTNARYLIDKIVHLQMVERELIYREFMSNNTRLSEKVNKDVVEKILQERNLLAEQVKRLLKEKCQLQTDLDNAKQIATKLNNELALVLHSTAESDPGTRSAKPESVRYRAANTPSKVTHGLHGSTPGSQRGTASSKSNLPVNTPIVAPVSTLPIVAPVSTLSSLPVSTLSSLPVSIPIVAPVSTLSSLPVGTPIVAPVSTLSSLPVSVPIITSVGIQGSKANVTGNSATLSAKERLKLRIQSARKKAEVKLSDTEASDESGSASDSSNEDPFAGDE